MKKQNLRKQKNISVTFGWANISLIQHQIYDPWNKNLINCTSSKFKNFCFLYDTIKRMKRQVIDLEKIFVYHRSEKLSRIVKIPYEKTSKPNKNSQKILNGHFYQRRYMASKWFGKCKLKPEWDTNTLLLTFLQCRRKKSDQSSCSWMRRAIWSLHTVLVNILK